VFVSVGDGQDFSRENSHRGLGMEAVLHLQVNVTSILQWEADDRLAFFKQVRLEFVKNNFGLSDEEANAVIRYIVRIIKDRPDLEKAADWLDTREGERALGLYLNQKLQDLGYDAVRYREPFHGVDQMIVLDPSKITVVG
jgi:hypothetical protein